MENVSVKEAVEKLRQIRSWYERGFITMKVANAMGKNYVDIVNKFYNKKAKEHGLGSRSIRYNVKFWPNN